MTVLFSYVSAKFAVPNFKMQHSMLKCGFQTDFKQLSLGVASFCDNIVIFSFGPEMLVFVLVSSVAVRLRLQTCFAHEEG